MLRQCSDKVILAAYHFLIAFAWHIRMNWLFGGDLLSACAHSTSSGGAGPAVLRYHEELGLFTMCWSWYLQGGNGNIPIPRDVPESPTAEINSNTLWFEPEAASEACDGLDLGGCRWIFRKWNSSKPSHCGKSIKAPMKMCETLLHQQTRQVLTLAHEVEGRKWQSWGRAFGPKMQLDDGRWAAIWLVSKRFHVYCLFFNTLGLGSRETCLGQLVAHRSPTFSMAQNFHIRLSRKSEILSIVHGTMCNGQRFGCFIVLSTLCSPVHAAWVRDEVWTHPCERHEAHRCHYPDRKFCCPCRGTPFPSFPSKGCRTLDD